MPRRDAWLHARRLGVLLLASLCTGCAGSRELAMDDADPTSAGADPSAQYLVVDCLLPPRLIRQGERSVTMLPSRPAKLSSRQCAQQGGAQTAGLGAWAQLAASGDAEAQTYLGEMYEHGIGGAPRDPAKARDLYTKAAAAGNARARSNLSQMLAGGAPGVTKNPDQAKQLVAQNLTGVGIDRNLVAVVATSSRQPALPAGTVDGGDLKRFAFGRYHALLIGNSDYRNAPKLASPVNEVDVIGELLERRYGFRVVKLKNATRDQILRKLDDLDEELKAGDNLLVYYTGHGAESASREGFWIPVDGEAPTSQSRTRTRLWVSSSEVREKLSVMAPKHILVVADSCYSARFLQFRGIFNPSSSQASSVYLEAFGKLYASKSRTALTSGGLAPVIEPNDGSNLSPFAKAFSRFLESNREPVPSAQIFSSIQLDVMTATSRLGFAQQPQWGPIESAGHESGDFWFRPR